MERANRVDFANTLRGVAALCVVLEHYFHVFWKSESVISNLTHTPNFSSKIGIPIYIDWINNVPFLAWGPFGVALFFLISGFVIPFSLSKSKAFQFLLYRVIRIYPVYFAGLSITLLAIYLGGLFYGQAWPLDFATVFRHIPGMRDLLWSPMIDGIIWTLEIEVKFYLICALTSSLLKKGSALVFIVPLLIFIPALCVDKNLQWLLVTHFEFYKQAANFIAAAPYLIFMFIGVSFHFVFRGWIAAERAMLLCALQFTAFVILVYTGPIQSQLPIVWSYGFAAILFLFAYCYPDLFSANRMTDFFASISYPLYVLHGIAGYVALRILVGSGVKASVSLIIVTSVAVLLAWVVHKSIERPCQRLIDRLKEAEDNKKLAKRSVTALRVPEVVA